ncbi:MAG: 2-hydroxyacid dehydrogenase [Candidatus Micrarchaeia archaeon]
MGKWKVYVSRTLPGNALARLAEECDLELNREDRVVSKEEIKGKVNGKDALLCLLTDKIDAEVLDAAGEQLKVVSNYAVGFDNIDVKAATERGIPITNTPGVLTEAVAEHTFALLLSLARRIPESDKFVRAGKYKGWAPEMFLGKQLEGKTLGIIGLGRIGFKVAEYAAKGMGMKVAYNDLKPNTEFEKEFNAKYLEREELLKQSDFVSLHVPLLPSTKHLIGEKELGLMKPSACLINTARGPIIDEKALVTALQNKKIRGAALDVYENEPELTQGLAELNNTVLTPHTASATEETRSAMAELAVDNLLAVLTGNLPKSLVNKEVWEKRRK